MFTELSITQSIINHKKNLKTIIYMRHVNLQNVIWLSASSLHPWVDQTDEKIFLFSVTWFLLFVVYSSF